MVELDKFLPVNREEAFRNGVNENFAKIEQGFSQRDAVMANHQTTQKNAHNSKQIKHVLWDVEQELKYRAAQVSNLVIGANGDGIAETKDARTAVFSKKAHATLSERLLEDFTMFSNKIDPIYTDEYSLNLSNKQVVKFADIAAYSNSVIRGIAIDSRKDEIYVYQTDGDGAVISRHLLNGVMLDKMTLSEAVGNPLSLGLVFPNGNATLIFNVKKGNEYYVAYSEYLANASINANKMTIINFLKSSYDRTSASVDEKRNELLFVNGREAIIYKLSHAMKNKATIVRSFTLEKDESDDHLKGFKLWNKEVYVMSGTQSIAMTHLISVYDENGYKQYNFKMGSFKNDYRVGAEAAFGWSLDIYHDDYTNKISLVFGVTYIDNGFRKQQLFAIHQKGREADHTQKIMSHAQNYAMTDGAGRMFNVLSNTTSLKELDLPGIYYIRSSYAKKITDIPGDLNDGEHGYFVENSAYNDFGVLIQKVRVYAVNGTSDVYERSYDTRNKAAGQWWLTPVYGSTTPNYMVLPKTMRLSDVKTFGEQYITSDIIAKMVDFDEKYKGNGYLFSNSSLMASNGRVQTMTRNSTSQPFLMLKRVVNKDGATAWKEM